MDSEGKTMIFVGFIIILVIGALSVVGLVWNRHAAPYAEETRRQTYETSRSYNQGMAVDLDDLCRQWRTNADPVTKAGLADTIRLRSARYTGELPSHVQACVEEVR